MNRCRKHIFEETTFEDLMLTEKENRERHAAETQKPEKIGNHKSCEILENLPWVKPKNLSQAREAPHRGERKCGLWKVLEVSRVIKGSQRELKGLQKALCGF